MAGMGDSLREALGRRHMPTSWTSEIMQRNQRAVDRDHPGEPYARISQLAPIRELCGEIDVWQSGRALRLSTWLTFG